MTPLCELAMRYHTDKGPIPGNPYAHNYTPYYHSLFHDCRASVTAVFEMGLGTPGLMHEDYPAGASLLMWRDYFPNAQVYGADISPGALIQSDGIRTFLCDQSDIHSLRRLVRDLYDAGCGGFDLIMDDGTHALAHQTLTAQILHPYLTDGGIYVIEDFEGGAYIDLWSMGFRSITRTGMNGCLLVSKK